MIYLEAKTKLTSEEVANRLKKFFGKGGLGLELTEDAPSVSPLKGVAAM